MRSLIGLTLAGIVACSGGEAPPSGPTLAQLTEVQGQVHGFQPWDKAETTLKGALGDPSSTEGDAWKWVAREGDKCHTLTVTKMVTTVGSVNLEETPCP